jgi:glycolate oxidase
MIPTNVLKELSEIVGSIHFIARQEELARFASDGTKLEFIPDAVAFPGDSDEISKIFQLANRENFPVIPRGGGSGMSGGSLPVDGGLILSMDRLNRILLIDEDNLIAKAEPGVITARFQEEVEKLDLFYPPDPASADVSTLGGNVAECAGGLRGLKYGVTRDYVLGLTVILPTGEIVDTGVETLKGVAGYDLTRLIIGSEGTLAVVSSITLRLIPKPAAKRTMTAFFPDISSSVRTVSDIIRGKIVPSTLEFLDRLSIECVREEMGIDILEEAEAMLLIEVDGDDLVVNMESKKVEKICMLSGAIEFKIARGQEEAEKLWQARRAVSPSLMKLRPGKLSEDVVVPRSRMPELVSFLSELSDRYGLPIPAFGHAGDGNIHVNIMIDKDNQEDVRNGEKVVKELFKKVVDMGGTITGEHGIGITKAPYMEIEFSKSAIELMSRLKRAFDPNNILNPGKILPNFTA